MRLIEVTERLEKVVSSSTFSVRPIMSMTISPACSPLSSLSLHTTHSQVATDEEAEVLQSMKILIELPATSEHARLRHQSVCRLLEAMYHRFIAGHQSAASSLWTQGLQRLAKLWLANPPVIQWKSEQLTCNQAWCWLRTSLKRSVLALCKRQGRYQERHRSMEILEEERGDRFLQDVSPGLDEHALRGTLESLVSRLRALVQELVDRYAARRDVRRAIPQHTERLLQLLFYPELEDWIRAHHPERMHDAQNLRRFRDRLHTQHKRTRRFLRKALELYLEEHEVEEEVLALIHQL